MRDSVGKYGGTGQVTDGDIIRLRRDATIHTHRHTHTYTLTHTLTHRLTHIMKFYNKRA